MVYIGALWVIWLVLVNRVNNHVGCASISDVLQLVLPARR